jgi:hypothetical protein
MRDHIDRVNRLLAEREVGREPAVRKAAPASGRTTVGAAIAGGRP